VLIVVVVVVVMVVVMVVVSAVEHCIKTHSHFLLLHFLHFIPHQIARMPIGDLKAHFEISRLDIVEKRAFYYSLPTKFECDPTGEKEEWKRSIFADLMSVVEKEKLPGGLSKEKMRAKAYAAFTSTTTPPPPSSSSSYSTMLMGPYDPDAPLVSREVKESMGSRGNDLKNELEICRQSSLMRSNSSSSTVISSITSGTFSRSSSTTLSRSSSMANEETVLSRKSSTSTISIIPSISSSGNTAAIEQVLEGVIGNGKVTNTDIISTKTNGSTISSSGGGGGGGNNAAFKHVLEGVISKKKTNSDSNTTSSIATSSSGSKSGDSTSTTSITTPSRADLRLVLEGVLAKRKM